MLLLIVAHVQAAVLCDVRNKQKVKVYPHLLSLPFKELQEEKERSVDKSSLEQQFCKSDMITFVV